MFYCKKYRVSQHVPDKDKAKKARNIVYIQAMQHRQILPRARNPRKRNQLKRHNPVRIATISIKQVRNYVKARAKVRSLIIYEVRESKKFENLRILKINFENVRILKINFENVRILKIKELKKIDKL